MILPSIEKLACEPLSDKILELLTRLSSCSRSPNDLILLIGDAKLLSTYHANSGNAHQLENQPTPASAGPANHPELSVAHATTALGDTSRPWSTKIYFGGGCFTLFYRGLWQSSYLTRSSNAIFAIGIQGSIAKHAPGTA